MAPPMNSPLGDDVEGGGGAHVDDDGGSAVLVEGGDAVDDAVGADFGGIVGEDGEAGFDAGLDEEGLDLEENLADAAESRVEGRDDRGDGDAVDVIEGVTGGEEEAAEGDADLVEGLVAGCGDAPVGDEFRGRAEAVETEDRVSVACVDG